MQLEQANPQKCRKVGPNPNESFISLAQVGAQRNCEPVQRTIKARAQEVTIVVHSEEVNGNTDEELSSVQPGGSIRRARQHKTPSVEESD
jgi:hypothetical protein